MSLLMTEDEIVLRLRAWGAPLDKCQQSFPFVPLTHFPEDSIMPRKSQQSAPRMARQGDVLLVAIAAATTAIGQAIPRDNGRVVLAYGEVTGHAHAIIEPKVTLRAISDAAAAQQLLASVGLVVEIRDNEVVGLLEVDEAAELRHEEHATIALGAGERFVVLRQREYSPDALQTVAD